MSVHVWEGERGHLHTVGLHRRGEERTFAPKRHGDALRGGREDGVGQAVALPGRGVHPWARGRETSGPRPVWSSLGSGGTWERAWGLAAPSSLLCVHEVTERQTGLETGVRLEATLTRPLY